MFVYCLLLVCEQVATVTPERLFHMLSKDELEEIIKKLPA